jgi:hypothetical protein
MFRSLLKYDEIHRTGRKVKILPTVVPGRSITQAGREGKGNEKDRPHRSPGGLAEMGGERKGPSLSFPYAPNYEYMHINALKTGKILHKNA